MLASDYLVVGAGAAGMAVTDALLTHSDSTITVVDRRFAPGGHWNDAYPHVRLHQPSAFYGVDSTPLGHDNIDHSGWNAGYYELASADEIRSYFQRVMQHRFLASGRVQYFPNCDYLGEQRVLSRLTGKQWDIRVARKIIDTTYLEGAIPATSAAPFEVGNGVHCVPAGAIARLDWQPQEFVVIGAGKTAIDTCIWLLEQGIRPSCIRWVKPRECWWLNRRFFQPHSRLPDVFRGAALQMEAMSQATSLADLFVRLESAMVAMRVDTTVTPTMYRGSVIGEAEIELVRRVEKVIRLGHVRSIGLDSITLDHGEVATSPRSLHIHCAAQGLARPALRPIFEPDRMTVQPFMRGIACFQFAMLGVAEALLGSDVEKNQLFPPINYWDSITDFATGFLVNVKHARGLAAYPALASWAKQSRLNPQAENEHYSKHPTMIESKNRINQFKPAAIENITRLVGARGA